MRFPTTFRWILAALLVTGAASASAATPLAVHQPTLENLTALRDAKIASLAVGEFKPAATLKPGADKKVSVRGHGIVSAYEKSFALQVREALIAELTAAALLDATSGTVISGELVENQLRGGGMSKNTAVIAVQFVVKRGDAVAFDKTVRVPIEWKGSFVGAIAIPESFNQYATLYPKVLAQLYADPDFIAACAAK